MMVLIDTSAWIRSFAGAVAYKSVVDRLVDLDQAARHDLVFGELFIGDVGGRDRFLRDYSLLYCAQTVPHQEVIQLVRFRRLHGRGLSWIDVHLLASALAEHMQLWSADEFLMAAAEELGVAYQEPRPTLVHGSRRAKEESEQG
jgi:predicted nucleic acid-binding protein